VKGGQLKLEERVLRNSSITKYARDLTRNAEPCSKLRESKRPLGFKGSNPSNHEDVWESAHGLHVFSTSVSDRDN
jgi:hypothetical protein